MRHEDFSKAHRDKIERFANARGLKPAAVVARFEELSAGNYRRHAPAVFAAARATA